MELSMSEQEKEKYKGLVVRLYEMPDDQFELILDLYRVYGTHFVGGAIQAVAEIRMYEKEIGKR